MATVGRGGGEWGGICTGYVNVGKGWEHGRMGQ